MKAYYLLPLLALAGCAQEEPAVVAVAPTAVPTATPVPSPTPTYPPVQIGPPPGATPVAAPTPRSVIGRALRRTQSERASRAIARPSVVNSPKAITSWDQLNPEQQQRFVAELEYAQTFGRWTRNLQSAFSDSRGKSFDEMVPRLSAEVDAVYMESMTTFAPRRFLRGDALFREGLRVTRRGIMALKLGDRRGAATVKTGLDLVDRGNAEIRSVVAQGVKDLENGRF